MQQTSQNTEDQISNWALTNYAATPTPAVAAAPATSGSGMLSTATPTAVAPPAPQAAASSPSTTPSTTSTWATTTPAVTTPAASTASASMPAPATPAVTPASKVDINSWYRNELGRDGDAAGIQFWQNALNNGADAQQLYQEFSKAAQVNKEAFKPVDWSSANTYTGTVSSNPNSNVDEWGRNVLGRTLTAAEQSKWDGLIAAADTPEKAQAVYQQFLTESAGQVKNNLDLGHASQITPYAASTTPAAQIALGDLATRTIDKPTETVAGQLNTLLAENSPVLQKARADAMRTAADRGMLNSAMAASGGEAAAIGAATGIATTDSGYYNNAANYNAAAQNQATMWNADQVAQLQRLNMQLNDAAAGRAQSLTLAQMQDATSRYQAEMSAGTSKYNTDVSAATSKYSAEMSANTSRYNTDASYKQQMDNQKQALINNIISNMEWSPDRKAAMLEALGAGTSAKQNADGSYSPGTGLAGAVYVIGSTSADLYNSSSSLAYPSATGPVGSAINEAISQVNQQP